MEAYDLDKLITFSGESHTKHVFFESEKRKAVTTMSLLAVQIRS